MFTSADGQSLYYYGGYFSDNPVVEPDAFELYSYNIPNGQWSQTPTSGDPISRASSGAGAVVPPLDGRTQPQFFYFGGHMDSFTTQGWSNQTPRVYLNSMIEYDQQANTWRNHSSVSYYEIRIDALLRQMS